LNWSKVKTRARTAFAQVTPDEIVIGVFWWHHVPWWLGYVQVSEVLVVLVVEGVPDHQDELSWMDSS